jgi:hypothetical protein
VTYTNLPSRQDLSILARASRSASIIGPAGRTLVDSSVSYFPVIKFWRRKAEFDEGISVVAFDKFHHLLLSSLP